MAELTIEQQRALARARARARIAQGASRVDGRQPIQQGDWRELDARLDYAQAGPEGPPTREQAMERRRQAAREEGLIYGASRGENDTEAFLRSMGNIGGLGVPNFLEAATSGMGSGVALPERHEFIKAADEGRASASPVAAGLGMGAGILGQAAALPSMIPALARAPQTVGQAARLGAAVGGGTAAVDTAVNTRGDPMQTTQSALFGTALGGGAGALVQAATPAVAAAGRAIGDRVRFVTRSPRENAAVHVARSFENVPRAQVDDVLRHPDARLLDAGETAARDTFRGATNLNPQSHQRAQQFLNDRAGREAASLTDDVTRTLGGGQSVNQAQQAIRDRAQRATAELYRRAFSEAPDVWDDSLARFTQSNIGKQLVPKAMERVNREYAARALRGEPVVAPPMPFVVDELGEVSLRPDVRVGLEFWDAMSKELNDMVTSAVQQGNRTNSMLLGDISRALKARLDAAAPTYGRARGAAAEAFGAQDALEAGAMVARDVTRDGRDVAALLRSLPPDQRLQAAQGGGADLVRQISSRERIPRDGGTRSIVNDVFTPERVRRAQMLAPDEAAAGDLTRSIDMWRRFAESRASLGNSSTARQLATQAAIAGAPIAASSYMNQGLPDPQMVALGLALAGGNAARMARGQAISDDIVNFYLSRGPIPQPSPIVPPIPQAAREGIQRSILLGSGLTAGQTVSP